MDEPIIYTKIGDRGNTSLYDGLDVPKNSDRIMANGDIDEVVSALGVARCYAVDEKVEKVIHRVQRKLFDVMAEVATIDTSNLRSTITAEDVTELENQIDEMLKHFDLPTTFIMPGTDKASAHLHIARSVCRRAERTLVTLFRNCPEGLNKNLLIYVNRLSDMIYALSRYSEVTYEKVEF